MGLALGPCGVMANAVASRQGGLGSEVSCAEFACSPHARGTDLSRHVMQFGVLAGFN